MNNKSGKYAVPEEIRRLKPEGIPCTVKKLNGIYYVYRFGRVANPDGTKGKPKTGEMIGKIDGGVFIPNSNMTGNRIMKLRDSSRDVWDYGAYAIVTACTGDVLERLRDCFQEEDAVAIYCLAVIDFINGKTPASYVADVFGQSILSRRFRSLPFSEDTVGKLLNNLGSHHAPCDKFQQSLIDDSSSLTAIDGHVILSCSVKNDLADYGSKYRKIGNKQLNMIMAYDVEEKTPLCNYAYEGGVNDKTAVQDLFARMEFKGKTFLVDMGFYSEHDIGLYRGNGNHFIIPVPENTIISRQARKDISFTTVFTYEKENGAGGKERVNVLCRETTVGELEEQYLADLRKQIDETNREEERKAKGGKYKKKYMPRTERSNWPDDRVLICRDQEMHDALYKEYEAKIGADDNFTEGQLKEMEPSLGLIILRLDRKDLSPGEGYSTYKFRWGIETNNDHIKNEVGYKSLQKQSYYSIQGVAFIELVEGLVESRFASKKAASQDKSVRGYSKKECIIKANHAKVMSEKDKKWFCTPIKTKVGKIFESFDVDVEADLKKLSEGTYGIK